MFIFLVTVVILLTIFGFSYSRSSSLGVLRAIPDDGGESSIIRLPEFMHRTPLIHHPQPGSEGDGEFVTSLSQHSFERSAEAMEQTNIREVDGRLRDDVFQLERRIIDQKIRDANQLGLFVESLWPHTLPESSDTVQDANSTLKRTDPSKVVNQNISHTIYNMIQSEMFKEAMAAIKQQQEQEEAAAAPETNIQNVNTSENDEKNVAADEKKNFPTDDKNVIR